MKGVNALLEPEPTAPKKLFIILLPYVLYEGTQYGPNYIVVIFNEANAEHLAVALVTKHFGVALIAGHVLTQTAVLYHALTEAAKVPFAYYSTIVVVITEVYGTKSN